MGTQTGPGKVDYRGDYNSFPCTSYRQAKNTQWKASMSWTVYYFVLINDMFNFCYLLYLIFNASFCEPKWIVFFFIMKNRKCNSSLVINPKLKCMYTIYFFKRYKQNRNVLLLHTCIIEITVENVL